MGELDAVPEGAPVCGALHGHLVDLACSKPPHDPALRHQFVSESGQVIRWYGAGRTTTTFHLLGEAP